MAQSLPSGSQILAEETQKMVQSELIKRAREGEKEPPNPQPQQNLQPKDPHEAQLF